MMHSRKYFVRMVDNTKDNILFLKIYEIDRRGYMQSEKEKYRFPKVSVDRLVQNGSSSYFPVARDRFKPYPTTVFQVPTII